MSRSLLIGVLVVDAAILALIFGFERPAAIYSTRVSEFALRGLWDRQVRVEGVLVHGTLCKVDARCGYRFRMADYPRLNADGTEVPLSREELSVSYDGCVVPDTFREVPGIDSRVTVEGERCRGCHDFKASAIIVKCPAKYYRGRFGGACASASVTVPRCGSWTTSK